MADISKTIKDLEECLSASCRGYKPKVYCPHRDEEWDIMRDALELLNEQPKWIPINERKPNSCGTYIVARWFIDGCRRKILTDACYFDGSNTWHDDTRVNHSRPYITDKIVAWMPLPNPPKDGEQE